MGLLDDITEPVRVYPCKVREVRDSLEESDQKKLDELLADERWKNKTLATALAGKGVKIDVQRLSAHRNGSCSCSKM